MGAGRGSKEERGTWGARWRPQATASPLPSSPHVALPLPPKGQRRFGPCRRRSGQVQHEGKGEEGGGGWREEGE
eukprot:2351852-Rhodomonas_salina.1